MKTIEEQLQNVEQRLKHEQSKHMFERYQTVKLYLLGKSNEDIAISIGRKESIVGTYLWLYRSKAPKLPLSLFS